MFKKIFLLLFLSFSFINAQEIKFGKVSMDELKETVYEKDSSASAAYLFRKIRISYIYSPEDGFEQKKEVHERIKIYDKKGVDYATKKVRLYDSGSANEEVGGLKGYTFNLENGKVVQTKLGKDGIFKANLSKYYNEKKFTFPNVKEGSIIDYKYTINSPFTRNIDEVGLQFFIPVKKQEIKLEIPEYYFFTPNVKGYLALNPVKSKGKGSAKWTDRSRSGVYVAKTTFNQRAVGYETNITTYSMANVPALKIEPFVNNMSNYLASVKYELSNTKFPDQPIESYTRTWENVTSKIYKNPNFGGELGKKGYFEDDVDAAISGVSNSAQKIAIILNLVKSKVKWNGYRGVGCEEGVRKAYKNGSGNSGDINIILLTMLKYSGIDSYPVVLSTRDHGIPFSPTLEGFNYVVAAAKVEDRYVLLDATDPSSIPEVLPVRTLNWFGRMISEKGTSTLVNLMPNKKSSEVIMMNVKMHADGNIEGSLRQQFTNHNSMLFRNNYNRQKEDAFLEELEKRNDNLEISNYKLKNNDNIYKPIIQSYEFLKEDMVDTAGDKLYFLPMFYHADVENPFKLDKREYPIDFGFPWEDKYLINVQIPEGYAVESLPKPFAIALPDNLGSFKYNITANGNIVNLTAAININAAIIAPNQYDALKEFYKLMVEKQTERVVLKKI